MSNLAQETSGAYAAAMIAYQQFRLNNVFGMLDETGSKVQECAVAILKAVRAADPPETHAALKRLTHAAESFAGSDPDMPSHAETEAEFEAALSAAYVAIAKAEGEHPPVRER